MREKLKYLCFLIIPAIIFFMVQELREVWGTYYYNLNSDPAYLYLVNSLNIATLKPVEHVDNPGTPVQVLGGMVIRITAWINGAKDIDQAVFQNPEYYLLVINRVFFWMNIVAIVLLGIASYRLTRNIWFALLLQSTPFASWLLFKALLKVSPEPLSFFVCILFIILFVLIAERGILATHLRVYTVVFATLTAFALATKLTFVPFAIIPLIVLPGIRWKTIYVALTTALFHIFIFPAWGHYDYLFNWIKDLLIHTEQYGTGNPGFVDLKYSAVNFLKLTALDHTLYIAVAAACTLLFVIFFNPMLRKQLRKHPAVRILAAISFAVVVNLLLVAKHYNPHYMIPSLMLFTTIIYLDIKVYRMITSIIPSPFTVTGLIRAKIIAVIAIACALFLRHHVRHLGDTGIAQWAENTLFPKLPLLLSFVIVFVLIIAALRYFKMPLQRVNSFLTFALVVSAYCYQLRHADIAGFYRRLMSSQQEALAVIDLVENKYRNAVKIYGEKSSSCYYALRYGAEFNFPQPAHCERMREFYPDEKIFFWGMVWHPRVFSDWTGQVKLAEIMDKERQVVLQGDKFSLTPGNIAEIENTNGVVLENVFRGNLEVVYLVKRVGEQ